MNRRLTLAWAFGFVAGACAMLLAVLVVTSSDAEAQPYKPPHVLASHGSRDLVVGLNDPEPVHTPLVPHLYDYDGEAAHLEEKRQTAEHDAQVAAAEAARREVVRTRQAESSQGSPGGSWESVAACIRRYESGGNYEAVSASGKYRGAYQFDAATWASVGGSGDPAAASPAEQDLRARLLWERRGLSPWPTPNRRCR